MIPFGILIQQILGITPDYGPPGGRDSWVSHWSLEEVSGDSADDLGSNTLLDTNTVTQATGIVGKSRFFTAASQEYFKIDTGTHNLSAEEGDFTFWTWFKPTTLPSIFAIASVKIWGGSSMGSYNWALQYDGGILKLYLPSNVAWLNAAATTFGALTPGETYFVLCQYNHATNTIGIKINNGTLDTGTGPVTPNNPGGDVPFLLGSVSIASRYFDGWMDQAGFARAILSQEDQDWLWNDGAGRSYAAPVASDPIEFIGSTFVKGTQGTGDLLIDVPTGTQENDLVIMFDANRNSFVALPTGGSTWVEELGYHVLISSVVTPPTTNDRHFVWSKIAGASEPAQYIIPYTDDGSFDGYCIICVTFRNADSVEDYAVVGGTATAPSVTAVEGDTLISWHGTVSETSSEASVVRPDGMTLVDKQWDGVPDAGIAVAYKVNLTPGTTGNKIWSTAWTGYEFSGNILIRDSGWVGDTGDDVYFLDSTTLVSINTGNNTINITVPSHSEGDMMVIHGTSRNSYIGEPEGGGWTLVYNRSVHQGALQAPGQSNDQIYLWWKFAGASEPATYSFLIADDGTDGQVILCASFRNATGIDCVEMYGNHGEVAPSTLAADGDLLVSIHGATYDSSGHTSTVIPSGMTLIDLAYNANADVATTWCWEKVEIDGYTGDKGWISDENDYEFTGNIVLRGINPLPQPTLTNLMPVDSRDMTGNWSLNDTPVISFDQTGLEGSPNTASKVEDDSASDGEYIWLPIDIGTDYGWYVIRYFIAKDAVDKTTRSIETGLRSANSTSAPTGDGISLNWATDDGVVNNTRKNSSGAAYYEINSWDDDWWEVVMSFHNGEDQYIHAVIIPATGVGVYSASQQGFIICGGVELYYEVTRAAVVGRDPNPNL